MIVPVLWRIGARGRDVSEERFLIDTISCLETMLKRCSRAVADVYTRRFLARKSDNGKIRLSERRSQVLFAVRKRAERAPCGHRPKKPHTCINLILRPILPSIQASSRLKRFFRPIPGRGNFPISPRPPHRFEPEWPFSLLGIICFPIK